MYRRTVRHRLSQRLSVCPRAHTRTSYSLRPVTFRPLSRFGCYPSRHGWIKLKLAAPCSISPWSLNTPACQSVGTASHHFLCLKLLSSLQLLCLLSQIKGILRNVPLSCQTHAHLTDSCSLLNLEWPSSCPQRPEPE